VIDAIRKLRDTITPRRITQRRFKAYLFRNDCDVALPRGETWRVWYSQACLLNNNAIRYT